MSKDAWQVALERQLENDEPKCGNCRMWEKDVVTAGFGRCQWPAISKLTLSQPVTLDLAVCSQWGPK